MGKRYGTEELYLILYSIDSKTIKVRTNAHHQNSLPWQEVKLKIAQIFIEHSCE